MSNINASEHPSITFLSAFDAPLVAADAKFWKIVDSARKHVSVELADCVYASMEGIAEQLSRHKPIVAAMLDHPMVAQCVSSDSDIAARNANWERAVHDVGYRIAALGAFRSCKHVVSLDPLLEKELCERDVANNVPASALRALPSWGMFIEIGEEAKKYAPLSSLDGIFLSLFEENEQAILSVTAIDTKSLHPGLSIRMELSDDNSIGLFIDDMRRLAETSPGHPAAAGWPLLRYASNIALQLCGNTPEYVGDKKMERPSTLKSFGGLYFKEPVDVVFCKIDAPHPWQAAVRAKDFMDQQGSAQSTPQP